MARRSPVQDYAPAPVQDGFAASTSTFTEILGWLGQDQTVLTHAEIEDRLDIEGRELLRQMYQDRLDLCAERERRLVEVADADGALRGTAEPGRERALATMFGQVMVTRIAYRARGLPDLHPADAVLNLPAETHSHGLRRLAAVEATRGSFADAATAIGRATGVSVGKRQVEALTARAGTDITGFYATRETDACPHTTVLAMTYDAKGVVMRPDALRRGTAKAQASRKLTGRLSRGEKRCRKRMAEVACVYDLTPVARTAADIMPDQRGQARPAPAATGKWLTASLTDEAATDIAAGFAEATRRDPEHRRPWIALVDGNTHQIERIHAEARRHQASVPIIVDFVHVVEYVWKAAWCFFAEGDRAAETWVRDHARQVLAGRASIVAAAIRRKATYHGLDPGRRKAADTCAAYLLAKKPYLDYPTALAAGWPIATGVIEGACRHLVKDRMDITGARWGLDGAEAVLRLRALIANGDLDQYWQYHLRQEHQRIHTARYLDGLIPTR